MFTPKNYDYDCTRKCSYRPHGNIITTTLTKRSIPDEKLAAFIGKTCCNFSDIVDDLGRSAVHLSASVARYALLEWLLNQGAVINSRDYESGSTALHRAIYYGCIDCAVLLMRYGADSETLDQDSRAPLQSICRLCDFPDFKGVPSSNELLVWGSNKNYNLGTGSEDDAQTPQTVDYFRKEHICVEQMAIGSYHSLFLDKKSRLYAVGHGQGGRLGTGNESSLPTPKKVKVPMKKPGETICCISVSRNHSLVLTSHSSVFACGINESQQLGVRDAGEKLLLFKEVVTLRDLCVEGLIGVIARDHHSLVYSSTCIYIWGTNNGQLNVEDHIKVVPLPKLMRLPPRTCINFVESNNSATVVVNRDNVLLLFYNGKMRSIKPPNFEAVKSVSLVGGDNSKFTKGNPVALKLLILTQTNVVFLWYEMKQQFYRCLFSQIRISRIDKIFYNANQVLILSKGEVYRGKCSQIPIPAYGKPDVEKTRQNSGSIWSRCDNNQTEISQEYMIRIDLQRMANIDRVVDVSCNHEFSAFGVLQESNMKYFKLPVVPQAEYGFKKLYNEADVTDAVHDLVFHVDGETYAAHRFIVYSRAAGLREIISSYVDKDIYLSLDSLTGKMFELMLKWIYTNYLPNESDLQDVQRSLGPNSPTELVDVCELFLHFAEHFQVNGLSTFLRRHLQESPFYLPDLPDKSRYRFARLHHKNFPELYDVRIICAGDVELPAHKCILVARLEYFSMMFSHTWAEQTTVSLTTVPAEYMEPIIEFLYSSDAEFFRKQNHSENYLYNMIVFCDQFFIESLRKVCELLILEKINIRKCGDMLDFAAMYNCEVLRSGCMQYICQNLTRVLNQHVLDNCEPEALKFINKHYRNMFKDVFDYRMITPDADALDDQQLLSFISDFHVDLDDCKDETLLDDSNAAANKSKSKEPKSEKATRKYERDAISSMLESMNIAERTDSRARWTEKSKVVLEAQEVVEQLQMEAKSWRKVVDKKEEQKKKRVSLENAVKVNEILRKEDKQKADYVPLSKTPEKSQTWLRSMQTPEREADPATSPDTPKTPKASETPATSPYTSKSYNLDLTELATLPSREKLSQKQRKRLSSGSSAGGATPQMTATTLRSVTAGFITEETKPLAIPNAWGTLPTSPPSSYCDATPPTGSFADPTSFANMTRGPINRNDNGNSPNTHHTQNNSFSKILLEERQQRDYYERMRSKSLALTQIEETAIAELREFYNVDNVMDEVITIARKSVPRTMNFAVWYRN